MVNPLEALGIKKENTNFSKTLFYFIREFKINPLDEEYLIDGKKIVKRGMPISLFNALMQEMNEHYEREEREMKKARRK